MRFPYYCPNLDLRDVIKAFFYSSLFAKQKIEDYFRQLTGKKYILITNSCRTALYLTYKALEIRGEVITTPLTCKVAIDPIEETGNKVIFSDISISDLSIKTSDIEKRITPKTIAIQVVHHGGIASKMDEIIELARDHYLKVIEDCAQSLGATYHKKSTGSFGDIACFSLIKNAYGVGGGILATNSITFFQKVTSINKGLKPESKILVFYRIIRNIIETSRKNFIGKIFYKVLMAMKGRKKSYETVFGQLKKIRKAEIKIAAHQIGKFQCLHPKRRRIGEKYLELLSNHDLVINNGFSSETCSFTKFFIYHPIINSEKHLSQLHKRGIEAMHLEQRQGRSIQEPFITKNEAIMKGLINYAKVHDHLISLPLAEYFKEKQIKEIVTQVVDTIKA